MPHRTQQCCDDSRPFSFFHSVIHSFIPVPVSLKLCFLEGSLFRREEEEEEEEEEEKTNRRISTSLRKAWYSMSFMSEQNNSFTATTLPFQFAL